jgi:hypothetical protein
MAMSIAETDGLLRALMSPDNAIRQNAEAGAFSQLKQQPDCCVLSLLQVLRSQVAPEVRSMSALLLRRVIIKDDPSLWPQCTAETQTAFKTNVLESLGDAQLDPSTRKMVCDVVGELGVNIMDEGQWPQLLPFLFEKVNSGDPLQRESALHVFGMTASYLAESMSHHFNMLAQIMQRCIADPVNNGKVQVAGIRALGLLLVCIDEPSKRKVFQALVPGMLQALSSLINNNHIDAAQRSLEVLVDVADHQTDGAKAHATFFRPHLVPMVQAMLTWAGNKTLDDGLRQTAVELLIVFAEKAPTTCRKLPDNSFMKGILPLCFSMMLEIEEKDDDEEWEASEEWQTMDGNYEVGEEAIDRLANTIGPKRTLPVAFELMSQYMSQRSDWRYPHAGLIALTQLVEVMPSTPEQIKMVSDQVLTFLAAPHPRVRYAAIHAVGQISSDFGPTFQNMYHAQIIPALVQLFDDPSERVQCHAAGCLINFIDMCDPNLLEP